MTITTAAGMAEAIYIAPTAPTTAKTNITLFIRINVVPPPGRLYGLQSPS